MEFRALGFVVLAWTGPRRLQPHGTPNPISLEKSFQAFIATMQNPADTPSGLSRSVGSVSLGSSESMKILGRVFGSPRSSMDGLGSDLQYQVSG